MTIWLDRNLIQLNSNQILNITTARSDSSFLVAGDHSAWDRGEIREMLTQFLSVSKAISLPDLDEYNWRSDKVQLSVTAEKCRLASL